MASIFLQDREGRFAPTLLEGEDVHVRVAPCRTRTQQGAASLIEVTERSSERIGRGATFVRACPEGAGLEQWLILGGDDSRLLVNGEARALGVVALRHRDEVCIDGAAPLFFSTERPARIEICDDDLRVNCPRCTREIEFEDPFVRCPSCGVRHHQKIGRPCWTYAESCVHCNQPSDLSGELRWSPEEL